jgi:hypothetical protein
VTGDELSASIQINAESQPSFRLMLPCVLSTNETTLLISEELIRLSVLQLNYELSKSEVVLIANFDSRTNG